MREYFAWDKSPATKILAEFFGDHRVERLERDDGDKALSGTVTIQNKLTRPVSLLQCSIQPVRTLQAP